jgi:drug/metabolite transporter superfamily protein YnfA
VEFLKVFSLFVVTAIAEIVGCYLVACGWHTPGRERLDGGAVMLEGMGILMFGPRAA